MITLQSIRIRNFRAIKELTFRPAEEGITGIFGPNGAGKSSILTAVMFALYGTRPKGITVGALRRNQSDPTKDECSVSVVFTHNGQTVEVIREIRGTGNKVIANVNVEGVPVAITTPTAVDKWMVGRLGIDEEGFLTAFVIRQKELDSFVRADPAEKKRIIERMAGVETINKALIAARAREKDIRTQLEVLNINPDAVETSEAELQALQGEVSALAKKVDTILTDGKAAKAVMDEQEQYQRDLALATQEVEMQNLTIKHETRNIAEADSRMEELKHVVSAKGSADLAKVLKEKKEEYDTAYAELTGLQQRLAKLEADEERITRLIAELVNQFGADSLTNANSETIEGLVAEADRIRTLKAEATEKEKTLNTAIEVVSQKLEAVAVNLSLITEHDHPDCPTCFQKITDTSIVVEALNKEIVSLEEEGSRLEQELHSVLEEIQDYTVALSEADNQVQDYQELLRAQEEYNTLTVEQASLADSADLSALIEAQQAKVQTLNEEGVKLRSLEADQQAYANAEAKKKESAKTLEEATVALTAAEKAISESLFDEETYREAVERRNTLSVEYNTHNEQLVQLRTQLATLEANYSHEQKLLEQREKLTEQHKVAILTTQNLDRFRQNTVSTIAPELSEHATNVISEMTNGDFISVRVDEDFKAYLTNVKGQEVPTSWLSGGEESAVALALRLAVGFLITNGKSDLLWLDEPLTAQDKDRRAAILSTIRSLPIKQIIIINHAHEAQDIVDAEITLSKSFDGNTQYAEEEEAPDFDDVAGMPVDMYTPTW